MTNLIVYGKIMLAFKPFLSGEMSEWFKEPVLKTGDPQGPWVRIPLSPPKPNRLPVSVPILPAEVPKRPKGLPC